MQVWREFLGKKITPNKFLQLSAQPESMLKKRYFPLMVVQAIHNFIAPPIHRSYMF